MSRENSVPADSGSRTLTQTATPAAQTNDQGDQAGPSRPVAGVLKLRGDRSARRQKVVWSEETVDNEGMGKKKSKICCIYHKPKAYDQSSDESSSDESDCGHDHHRARTEGRDAKRPVGGPTQADEKHRSESSDSEGGAGDGAARPVKKPGKRSGRPEGSRKPTATPKANRYDHHPGASGQTG